MLEGFQATLDEASGMVNFYSVIPLVGVAALVGTQYRDTPFDREFDEAEAREQVGGDLLRAIARHESGFNPAAISPPNKNKTRDYGLMQINEVTARRFGFAGRELVAGGTVGVDVAVRRSVTIAAQLLKAVRTELGDKGNLYTMVAAYNAGSGAIKKRGIFNTAYVQSVLLHHQMYVLGSLIRSKRA